MKKELELKKTLDKLGIEEVLQKKVSKFSTSAYIGIPKRHFGKKATVFIFKNHK